MDENNEVIPENENIYELAEQKIQFGENLRRYIEKNKDIDGLQKLSRKINQELKFLRKVQYLQQIIFLSVLIQIYFLGV